MRRLSRMSLFLILVLMALPVLAADLDVPGTYTTIQAAIDAASAGDVIIIDTAAANYTEEITITMALTLQPAAFATPVLDGSILIQTDDPVTIDGLTVQHGSDMYGGISGAGGIIVAGSNHTVKNCTLVGDNVASYMGIHVSTGNNLTIQGNDLTGWHSAIYLNPSSGHVISGNNFHDNLYVGIGSDGISNISITNNTFSGHTEASWGEGMGVSNAGTGIVLRNNAFINNTFDVRNWGASGSVDAEENYWNGTAPVRNFGDVDAIPYWGDAAMTNLLPAPLVVDAGWNAFIIRENAIEGPPFIWGNNNHVPNAVEMVIFASGQKAALGTDIISGATVAQISTLHIDRLDDIGASGSEYGPYFNIWITDGLGNYAVIANEPSNGEWAGSRWDVANWDFLKTKTCKVYETPGWNTDSSWVHAIAGPAPLTFEDVAGLIIEAPPVAYITNPANGVGSGAPDDIDTNEALGFNWVFGDTSDNYVTGGGEGFVVDNYTATASYPVHNVDQDTWFGAIQPAIDAANSGDEITVAAGTYAETVAIDETVTLTGENKNTTFITGGMTFASPTGLTVQGFNISGVSASNSVLRTSGVVTDLTIYNCILDGSGTSAHCYSGGSMEGDVTITYTEMMNFTGWSLWDSRSGSGGDGSAMGTITFAHNNIHECDGSISFRGLSTDRTDVANVHNNTWTNIGDNFAQPSQHWAAFEINRTTALNFYNNVITTVALGQWGEGQGLQVWEIDTLDVHDNTFTDCYQGIWIYGGTLYGVPAGSVYDNVFSGSTDYTLAVDGDCTGSDILDARNNNWGDVTGPAHYTNPAGLGGVVSNRVNFTPWTGRTVTLVADLGFSPTGKTLGVDGYGYWEGTPALGLDDDFVTGFEPGAVAANVTAADPVKYTKYGFVPLAVFGRDVAVGELYDITYHTKKDDTHVADPADWFCQMYTNGTAHGWYGERINSEPYFSENLTETPGEWTKWATTAGEPNRLRFFDSNLSMGSYTDGFLQDMTNDQFYAPQTIMLFGLGTGSAWAEGFDGKLDGLTIELISGEKATINFISGNALITVTPATSGPVNCSDTVELTFNLTTDAYTPDVFGYSAVVRVDSDNEVLWGAIIDELPFTDDNEVFLTFDNGDGSWMISGTTVGNPTYPITAAGTYPLFSVVFDADTDGLAEITFDSFTLRDPDNQPISTTATGATIEVDCTAPLEVTGITADPGHNKVDVGWTHDDVDVDHFEIWRGMWYDTTPGASAYPEYDDLTGDVIPTRPTGSAVSGPVFPIPGEWERVDGGAVPDGADSFFDVFVPPLRGVFHYEVFAVDAAGNLSPVAATNDRATNYWLGDVDEDGEVKVTHDITALGTSYGLSHGDTGYDNLCDVGRTDDWSPMGIPTTDNAIDFEDLMVFALNYGVVAPMPIIEQNDATESAQIAWQMVQANVWSLYLAEPCVDLKGLNLRANVAAGSVLNIEAGALCDEQSEMVFIQNIESNGLDVGLALMGTDINFIGSGELMRVTFVDGVHPAQIEVLLRNSANQVVDHDMVATAVPDAMPTAYQMAQNFPNPFNPTTTISFDLPQLQDVKLAVFGPDGRKIVTLVNESMPAGFHAVTWNGRDAAGSQVASGVYFYRIEAGPLQQTSKMLMLK
jgi:nitrous oxidase accessory protein NosD